MKVFVVCMCILIEDFKHTHTDTFTATWYKMFLLHNKTSRINSPTTDLTFYYTLHESLTLAFLC